MREMSVDEAGEREREGSFIEKRCERGRRRREGEKREGGRDGCKREGKKDRKKGERKEREKYIYTYIHR